MMTSNTVRKLKNLIKKRDYSNSAEYISFLRKKGVRIGENCIFYDVRTTSIDSQNPEMVEIGDYVRITSGVQVLTHDYSFSVLCSVCGDVVGSVEPVKIGNNVFIGRNAIILKGVTINDNVIIGAGAIVSKDCEPNSVYAGNPAKRICSIKEMYQKRKNKQLENAKTIAINYYNRTGKKPDASVLREYQMIFTKRDSIPASLEELMKDSGCEQLCHDYYTNHEPEFNSLDDFLSWCGIM